MMTLTLIVKSQHSFDSQMVKVYDRQEFLNAATSITKFDLTKGTLSVNGKKKEIKFLSSINHINGSCTITFWAPANEEFYIVYWHYNNIYKIEYFNNINDIRIVYLSTVKIA